MVTSHMCQFGMVSKGPQGNMGPVMKPTRWLSSAPALLKRLGRTCPHKHKHAQLEGGRAAAAAVLGSRANGGRGTARITVDASGRVGINDDDPEATLDIGGSTAMQNLRCNDIASNANADLCVRRGLTDVDVDAPYNATYRSTHLDLREERASALQPQAQ